MYGVTINPHYLAPFSTSEGYINATSFGLYRNQSKNEQFIFIVMNIKKQNITQEINDCNKCNKIKHNTKS